MGSTPGGTGSSPRETAAFLGTVGDSAAGTPLIPGDVWEGGPACPFSPGRLWMRSEGPGRGAPRGLLGAPSTPESRGARAGGWVPDEPSNGQAQT